MFHYALLLTLYCFPIRLCILILLHVAACRYSCQHDWSPEGWDLLRERHIVLRELNIEPFRQIKFPSIPMISFDSYVVWRFHMDFFWFCVQSDAILLIFRWGLMLPYAFSLTLYCFSIFLCIPILLHVDACRYSCQSLPSEGRDVLRERNMVLRQLNIKPLKQIKNHIPWKTMRKYMFPSTL